MSRKHDRKGRSTGEARHVRLYYWMMASLAWKSLSSVERCVLIELMQRYNSANNGEISLAAREAAEALCLGKSTIARAFLKLEEVGFIEPVIKGSFDWKISLQQGKPTGRATRWRLNEFECNVSGKKPSKAFMTWEPEASEPAKMQNAVPPQAASVPMMGPLVPPQTHRMKKAPKAYPQRDHNGDTGLKSGPAVGQSIVYQVSPGSLGAGAPHQGGGDRHPLHDAAMEPAGLKPLGDILDLSKLVRPKDK